MTILLTVSGTMKLCARDNVFFFDKIFILFKYSSKQVINYGNVLDRTVRI